ncbi:MAG: TonB-dependent receptor [Gemmatimonadetes bacterium]|nr:TonB-dependent receptor [Gemmatimonadota bacterium]
MSRLRHVLSALLATAALAVPLTAQTITGVVVEEGTGQPLAGSLLLLVDDRGEIRSETLTDDSGAFHIEVPGYGEYVIRGSLIGYATIQSAPLRVGSGDELIVEVRMAIEAVPLEPLVVRSRGRGMGIQLDGFYERMDRGRQSGFGHFVSRQDVERTNPLRSTDLLRTIPGVRVVQGRSGYGAGVRMSGGCVPAIYVDGSQVNRQPIGSSSLDDFVPAFAIEGIEVYRGAAAQVGSYHDPGGCGLILVWTRRGSDSGEPWSWKKFFAGVGLFAAVLLLLQ